MPRIGGETGVGLNTAKEIDTSVKLDAEGRRLGPGCSREMTKEESVVLKRTGKLACPGPQNSEGHLLIDDEESGQRFLDPAKAQVDMPRVWPPCGGYMIDGRTSTRTSSPMMRPEMHCKTCNFTIRLYQI